MRKLKLLLVVCLLLLTISCNDSVNPKAEPKGGYVFYCIIDTDTTFQTAYLSKTYNAPGINPLENNTDPAVKKAKIVFTYQNKNYSFTDSSVIRTDTSRYKNDFGFYYNNNINLKSSHLSDVSYPVSVAVTLPDNRTLVSQAESIPSGDLMFTKSIGYFPSTNDGVWQKSCEFYWAFFSNKNSENKYYYRPVIEINYSKIENGVAVRKKYKVPDRIYNYAGGQNMPGYPEISKQKYVIYPITFIIEAFAKISDGDPNKNNYIIHNLALSINIMDKNAASYYEANKSFKDDFSVRLDQIDFSNISGGRGLFGLYATRKRYIPIISGFIEPFGYKLQPKL